MLPAEKLSAKYSIPQVEKKKEIIEKVQTNEFWDKVTIIERGAICSLISEISIVSRLSHDDEALKNST